MSVAQMSVPIRLTAEFIGTLVLVATIVAAGIMGDDMGAGNGALILLAKTAATGPVLAILIVVCVSLSGAHFNPAVTFVFCLRREIGIGLALAYVVLQVAGAVCGTWLVHLIFEQEIIQFSASPTGGLPHAVSEVYATFLLLATILGALRSRQEWLGPMVGAYVSASYWFTASTSALNPAVSIARSFTDSVSGIALMDLPFLIPFQLIGAALAFAFFYLLDRHSTASQ